MAAKTEKSDDKPKKKKGHPFLWGTTLGLLFGVAIGVIVGWSVRKPDSFKLDELKQATEKKIASGASSSKETLADWAEGLAKKLRQ